MDKDLFCVFVDNIYRSVYSKFADEKHITAGTKEYFDIITSLQQMKGIVRHWQQDIILLLGKFLWYICRTVEREIS